MEKISVAIRVRPPSKSLSPASSKGHHWCVGPHNVALYNALGTPVTGQNYSFDYVFGTDARNGDIYQGLTKAVIKSSLDGFNGTVFAYGQTSSGKTFTMKGSPTDPGIIRMAVHDAFGHIRQMASSREFLIRVSYMEIYNEEINDLFAPDNRRLRIHENLEKGIFVPGLREEIVDSPEQVFAVLESGESHRHFGETNMNLYSSRSHTIFRMVIESRDKSQDGGEADAVRVSCLNLVDLAGSERVAKTGAGGVRLKEGTHINKSLMTLGTVINKLSDGTGKQGGHVPYRDSKLTRILQPALGGNSRTVMICTVTPDEIHIDETRGTLQFASRAKRVSTCAQVNEIVTDAALLKRQTKEIEELRMKLQGLPQSNHSEKEILTLRNELLKNELEKERLYLELQEEKRAQIDRERRLKEQEQRIENLSNFVMSSNVDDRGSPAAEKFHKKVTRRETWCPRQLNSATVVEDFRKPNDQAEDDETMDNILFSVRRDRNFTLPPAFEVGEDFSSFPTASSEIEDLEPPAEFENIADEDTWMSLNKGHTTTSMVLTGFSGRITSSLGSGVGQSASALENQLKDLQGQYKELQISCDLKIQEGTQELQDKVKKLEIHIDQVEKENTSLSDILGAQLKMQHELQSTLVDLEFEISAARLQIGLMEGVLAESLDVQAMVLKAVQDCKVVTSAKGKHLDAGQRAKEKGLLMDNPIQQCTEVFADVDHVFEAKLSSSEEALSQSPSRPLQADIRNEEAAVYDKCVGTDSFISLEKGSVPKHQLSEKLSLEFSEAPKHQVSDNLSLDVEMDEVSKGLNDPRLGKFLQRNPNYCGGCLSSFFHTSQLDSNAEGVSGTGCTHAAEYDKDATEGMCSNSRRGTTLQSGENVDSRLEELSPEIAPDRLSYVPSNASRANVLRALASEEGTSSELGIPIGVAGRGDADPTAIWSENLGRSFDHSFNHERALALKNQIPTEMGKLCNLILDLFQPTFPTLCDARLRHSRKGTEVKQNGKLKARLVSAKFLATWLVEEVELIFGHDFDCLSCHVKESGNGGLLLEAVQVLLLQVANMGVTLLQVTCQDEGPKNDLIMHLNRVKDSHMKVKSSANEMQTDGFALKKRPPPSPQEGATVDRIPKSNNDRSDFERVGNTEESFQRGSSFYPERVLKVEGVEEMLGKVLQNSMPLLSTEHRVIKGNPMLLVLTFELETPQDAADIALHKEASAAKIRQVHVGAHTKYASDMFNMSGTSQRTSRSREEGHLSSALNPFHPGGLRVDNSNRSNLREVHSSRQSFDRVQLSCGSKQDLFKSNRERNLEISLAAAELEVVELKIEAEELRNKLQTQVDMSQMESVQQMRLDLQSFKERCTNYEHEMRLILEHSPSSWENVRKERLLMKMAEENNFLQGCLAKTKRHVIRSKAWRDEIRTWKDIQNTRRENPSDSQVAMSVDGRGSNNARWEFNLLRASTEGPLHHRPCMVDAMTDEMKRKIESYRDHARALPRTALRAMDVNSPQEENEFDPRNCSKGRRQLHFSGDGKSPG